MRAKWWIRMHPRKLKMVWVIMMNERAIKRVSEKG